MTKVQKVRVFILLASFCFLSSCGLFGKKEDPGKKLQYPKALTEVKNLTEANKLFDAQIKVEDYLKQTQNIHWYGHGYFLKGHIFELQGKDGLAIKEYKKAIQHTNSYDSAVEAKALYNLSFVYERMEKWNELSAVLIDLMKRRSFFKPIVSKVETPARLAAIYAFRNRMKEAAIFHREASGNYKKRVRTASFRASPEELSRSLYYLGLSVFSPEKESFSQLTKKLSWGQRYFLASAEASKNEWSSNSATQLLKLYDRLWLLIEKVEPAGLDFDPVAKKRQKQQVQLAMASDFYDLLWKLRANEFPYGNVNRHSKRIMDRVGFLSNHLEDFVLAMDLGPQMIRNKKIRNKPLLRYVEKEKKKIKVNKEMQTQNSSEKSTSEKATGKKGGTEPSPEKSKMELSPKTDIGEDPNL